MGPDEPADLVIEDAETIEEALTGALERVKELETAVRAARPVVASTAMRGVNGLRAQAERALKLIEALKLD